MARPRTIDTHTHILTLETAALLSKAGANVTITPDDAELSTLDVNGVIYRAFPTGGYDIPRRLKDMDAAGIDVHVLSATPQTYLYNLDPEVSATLAAIQNDQMAKLHGYRHFAVGAAGTRRRRAQTRHDPARLQGRDVCVQRQGHQPR
jgi:hypothetical protein